MKKEKIVDICMVALAVMAVWIIWFAESIQALAYIMMLMVFGLIVYKENFLKKK